MKDNRRPMEGTGDSAGNRTAQVSGRALKDKFR